MNRIDYDIAARTGYGEVRGEPDEGQIAFAHVLVNRIKLGRWGTNLLQVCLAPSQFSCWLPHDPNYPIITTVAEFDPLLVKLDGFIRAAVLGEPDITQNACWYYSISMAQPPKWDQGQSYIQIGRHKFFQKDSR